MINIQCITFIFIIFCSIQRHGFNASKILAIFPVDAKSHYIMYGTVVRELAARGHEITVASLFPEPPEAPNMKFIDLRNTMETPFFTIEFLKDMSHIDGIPDIVDYNVDVCISSINITSITELLNNEYDLLITELFGCDCFMALGHKLNIPIVGIISSVTLPWTTPLIGHIENPSYVPSYFLPFGQKMTFLERMINTFFSVYGYIRYDITSNRKIQKYVEDAMGPIPPLGSISKNVSLILSNSHFSVNHVKPTLPQLVEVGGLHIPNEIPPIPEGLEKFYNESKEGVILFSLGSYAPTETITEDKLKALLDVLGSIPYNVLWKINGTVEIKFPPNIKRSSWVPQLSVLCDSRTKLFIAHGGLLGMQEAMYCGVPILGIPLFADQYMNLQGIQEKGAGIMLYYDDINTDTLSSHIHKLLYEDRYRNKAKVLSNLFKDRPQHPLHTAIYWVEYVLRHKGAPHLRSPAQDLTWYQYILLDVFAVTLTALLGTLYMFIYLFRLLKALKKYCVCDQKQLHDKKNS